MLCLFQCAALPKVKVATNSKGRVAGKDSVVAVINDLRDVDGGHGVAVYRSALNVRGSLSWTSQFPTEMRGVEEYTLR